MTDESYTDTVFILRRMTSMSDYYPDRWAIIKIITPKETLYKVLAGWKGGFADPDYWKLNSGITKIEQDEHGFHYHGYSGSVYQCITVITMHMAQPCCHSLSMMITLRRW